MAECPETAARRTRALAGAMRGMVAGATLSPFETLVSSDTYHQRPCFSDDLRAAVGRTPADRDD